MIVEHRRVCGPILALFIAALATPAASARPANEFLNTQPAGAAAREAPAQVRVVEEGSGDFDWGDAAIGAGAALATVGVGGALVLGTRRGRPTTT